MTGGQEKTCIYCGESCEGLPRVKDRHGRYFHETCHGKAQREQWRRQEQFEHAASASFANEDTAAGEDVAVAELILNEIASPGDTATGTATGASNDSLSATKVTVAPESSVKSVSVLTCPECGAAVRPGAVVCLNCGYAEHPVTNVIAGARQFLTAPISLGIGWLISAKAIGITIIAVLASFIALAFFSQTGLRIFVGVYIALLAGSVIWAVLVGFKFGSAHGLLTLFVPFYIFYTVYALNENMYLKWVFTAQLVCIPACLVFYLDSIGVLENVGITL